MIKKLKKWWKRVLYGVSAKGEILDTPCSTHTVRMDEPIVFNDWMSSVSNEATKMQRQ